MPSEYTLASFVPDVPPELSEWVIETRVALVKAPSAALTLSLVAHAVSEEDPAGILILHAQEAENAMPALRDLAARRPSFRLCVVSDEAGLKETLAALISTPAPVRSVGIVSLPRLSGFSGPLAGCRCSAILGLLTMLPCERIVVGLTLRELTLGAESALTRHAGLVLTASGPAATDGAYTVFVQSVAAEALLLPLAARVTFNASRMAFLETAVRAQDGRP
jgi:hypothetical protein